MDSNAEMIRLAYAPGDRFRGERAFFARLYRANEGEDRDKLRPWHVRNVHAECEYQRRVGLVSGRFLASWPMFGWSCSRHESRTAPDAALRFVRAHHPGVVDLVDRVFGMA